jgi:hypothetical protein
VSDDFESETERLLCHLYRIVYEDLGMCGCGWPDEGLATVHELLVAFNDDDWQQRQAAITRLLPKDGVRHIVLSTLDHAELMEHGSSILGAWLTPRGKWWLYAVETVGGIDKVMSGFGGPGVGYPHTDEGCTDACWTVPDGWTPTSPEVTVPVVAEPAAACVRCLYGTPHQHEEAAS